MLRNVLVILVVCVLAGGCVMGYSLVPAGQGPVAKGAMKESG